MKKSPLKGRRLENVIARLAEKNGWRVEKRKMHGRRIQDLILRKNGLILVVQLKNTSKAGPKDVSQTRKDYVEYLNYLLSEELGVRVIPILVSKDFSERAKRRARSYGVFLYRLEEFEKYLKE